jgi:uncharacterized linocin/CFP29 family protein
VEVLNHKEAPINEQEWEALNQTVTQVARRQLVGRRFLPLFGPMGPGVQIVQVDRTASWDLGQVTMQGDMDDAVAVDRVYQRVPVLSKDFVLDWRDLEQARAAGGGLDWSQAAAAASFVALAEDHVIFHGIADQNLDGLLTVEGRHILSSEGWEEPGSGFVDASRAVSHLTSAGFMPPFTVIAGVTIYALWHRLYGNSGVLEVGQIERLVGGGVFPSALVPNNTFVVVAPGPENIDLAVGLDLSAAFVESTKMNHIFRVLETVSLRIKRTSAICQIWQQG